MSPRITSSTVRDLAEHYLGPAAKPGLTDDELLALLGRYFHIHLVLRGGNLILVAHPTPGQTAVNLKFPVAHKKLEETAQDVRHKAEIMPPRMGVGYGTLRTGQAAIQLSGNYAALSQLREQLNMALDHHDFDFEPFQYLRSDGNGPSGLIIRFLPDKTLPPAPTPELPAQPKEESAA